MKVKMNLVYLLASLILGTLAGFLISYSFQNKTIIIDDNEIEAKEFTSFLSEYDNQQVLKDFIIYKHLNSSPMEEEFKQQEINSNTLMLYLEKKYINKLIEEHREEFDKEYQSSLEDLAITYYMTSRFEDAQDIKFLTENGTSLFQSVMKVAGEQEALKVTSGTDTLNNLGISKGVTITQQKDNFYVVQVDSSGLLNEEEFKKDFAVNLEEFMFDEYLKQLFESQIGR